MRQRQASVNHSHTNEPLSAAAIGTTVHASFGNVHRHTLDMSRCLDMAPKGCDRHASSGPEAAARHDGRTLAGPESSPMPARWQIGSLATPAVFGV